MSEKTEKILIVDDDREQRMSLYGALSSQGYAVSVAESGTMALDMLEKNPADLVITDINMPGMDGLTLLGKLQAGMPELPVVVITGHATVETAVAAMKLGVFDYLLKPFPAELIVETAARAFAGRSVQSNTAKSIKKEKRAPVQKKSIVGE